MSFEAEQRFKPRTGVLTERVDGELLLMDLDKDFLFSLNEVGELIWNAVAAGRSAAALIDEIVQQFPEIEAAVIAEDAQALLQELLEAELIEPIG